MDCEWICTGEEIEEMDWQPLTEEEHLMLEMATIGWPVIDGVEYKLSIHGKDTRDRPIPHIHLDRSDDLAKNKFCFEISLVGMLSTGEPILVRQKDLINNSIDFKNKRQCSWKGYKRLYDGVVSYLNAVPTDDGAPRGARTNLESFVIHWNKESSSNPNELADYIKSHNIEVLDKYKTYFPSLYPTVAKTRKIVKNHHGKKK